MTKRKKLRTSGGEGIHTPRPPKNPRLGDSAGAPRSSQVGHVPHPEELEGSPGRAPSAEQSREEPEQSASSSPEEEAGAPSRLLGQPDEEPAPFPPSQNSVGRFVPQFAKPRRTVRRQAAMREEDLGSRACGSVRPYDGPGGARGCMASRPRLGSGAWPARSARDSWACRRAKARAPAWAAREQGDSGRPPARQPWAPSPAV
uniref:Uncharacterized protein n=1 Tax=Equus asinus asinus TaxID=83772 RepID=A0A8C4M6P2_EQUAS